MTLIAYADKTLYADRRSIIPATDGRAWDTFESMKLRISRNKHYAYASVGLLMNDPESIIFENDVNKSLKLHNHRLFGIQLEEVVYKYLFPEGNSRSIYLMTSETIHLITKDGSSVLNADVHFSEGSGASMFNYGYNLIKGPKTLDKIKKLYDHISSISPYSGPLMDHVTMKSLKPIIRKEETK